MVLGNLAFGSHDLFYDFVGRLSDPFSSVLEFYVSVSASIFHVMAKLAS